MDILNKTATDLAKLLKTRALTCQELLNKIFARIEALDPKIKAFISLYKDDAYKKAHEIDTLYDKGEKLPPFAGIPIAIKDNMCQKGKKTTCGSKILENFSSLYDATVIKKIEENHLIPIGTLNMDEFAMGSTCENSAFFPTKNPWNLEHVPGGSSGGSAAAVAARLVPLALGSDTGGSIRQPASFCNTVGLKPTYGRVSRFGLVAFASSLDQIGPITRSVEDAAQLLNIISGFDQNDSTSADTKVPDFTKSLGQDIQGLKLAVPKEIYDANLNSDVKIAFDNAIKTLKEQGASVDFIKLESLKYAVATYYIIAPAEASANLARFDGARYGYRFQGAKNLREMYTKSRGQGFGDEVQRRIILGTFVLSSGYYDAYYLKAQKVRALIKNDFNNAFQKYDAIVTPTNPTPAFKIGELAENPLAMYLADIATIPVNLAGLPAISIPSGFSKNGLPLGLQIIAKSFDEETMLKIAAKFQEATDFHIESPAILRS
ncbi:Asp-tRNA(Asn)/Glu-tRNA(Gln) amidotransferase subunit GatA [Candidatus Margulisiibacteriota bacterium]